MRPFYRSFVAIIAIFASVPVLAQTPPADPPASPSQQALSPEDQAKVREQLKQLAQAMGVETPQDKAILQKHDSGQQQAAPQQKNMAEVADKALDMVNGLVSSVSKTLQQVAPEVWRIMIRQQYAKAIADLIVPWSLLVLTIVYWAILKKKWREPQSNEGATAKLAFASVLPMCGGAIFGIWGVVALSDSIKYLINPEYYAVRDMLLMLLQPGQVQ